MKQRRREWDMGRRHSWRTLYHRIRREIKSAKRETASNIEVHDVNSTQFARGIRNVMGMEKNKKFNIASFDGLSDVEIGQQIRDFFTGICTKHPPLDLAKLPALLPAWNDLPVFE